MREQGASLMGDKQTGQRIGDPRVKSVSRFLGNPSSLFSKTWIPDHPETSMARGEVFGTTRDALGDFAESVTFVVCCRLARRTCLRMTS